MNEWLFIDNYSAQKIKLNVNALVFFYDVFYVFEYKVEYEISALSGYLKILFVF